MHKRLLPVLDNKTLERSVSTLEEQVSQLKKELKDQVSFSLIPSFFPLFSFYFIFILSDIWLFLFKQKDKTFEAQRKDRESLRTDVESTAAKRDYESQIEDLKRQLEQERQQKAAGKWSPNGRKASHCYSCRCVSF